MSRLAAIRAFVAVVEEGGFTAAATALSLSRSAVSKHVAALEEHLGARLLDRTTRRVAPTDVGQAFAERCRRVLAELDEAEAAVTRLTDRPRGLLRITAPTEYGAGWLAPRLGEFLHHHPELRIDLDLADRRVDLIEEGFDLGIRIGRLEDSSLVARLLEEDRRVVCAAPAYWDRFGRPARPDDLRDHNCLTYTYEASVGTWPFQGPEGPLRVRVGGNLVANSGRALCAAAVSGAGVAMLPRFIIEQELAKGLLEPVLNDWREDDRGIYALWPPGRHLSPKVRAFVDFLVREK